MEALTTSLNSSKNTLHHCEEEGGGAAADEGEDEGGAEGDGSAGLPMVAAVANDWEDTV